MITDLTEYHREYYYTRRAKLLAYLGDKCVRCGSEESLEFDHIEPELKSFDISANMTLSNPSVRAELDKCQLLCTPCHRAKTATENSGWTHGTWYSWQTMGCRCEVCWPLWRQFNDERNAARRSAATARLPYGRRSECGEYITYRRGCRCADCRAANAAAQRKLRAAKKLNG